MAHSTRPSTRSPGRRHTFVALVIVAALAGCGVGSEESSDTTAPPGGEDAAPTETIDLDEVIEASRDEERLIVYGNPSPDQWAPVIEAFEEAYPWITVETFDLGGTEAFQRYLSEESTGATTADVIVNTDGPGWLDLIDRGQVVDFAAPSLEGLPEIAVAAPGVFAMSVDPLIGVFNSHALPPDEQPTTLAGLADMAEDLDGRLGTVEVENGQVGLGFWGYIDATGEDGWEVLERLGPHSSAESSNGVLVGKLTSGEYAATYMTSGALRALIDTTETGDVLDYRYLEDATVLPTRGIAVTAAAEAPNAARLLVDFVLSEEGQEPLCAGGFTPYRDGNDCPQGLQAIQDEVGEDNTIVVGYPEELVSEGDAFRSRWNEAFGR